MFLFFGGGGCAEHVFFRFEAAVFGAFERHFGPVPAVLLSFGSGDAERGVAALGGATSGWPSFDATGSMR